jgi:hypothetical protein
MTDSQKATAEYRDRQSKIGLLGTQLKEADKGLHEATGRIDSLVKQKTALMSGLSLDDLNKDSPTTRNIKYLDDTALAVQKQAAELKSRKEELFKAIEDIGARQPGTDLGPVPSNAAEPAAPDAGVLPPVGAIPNGGFRTKEDVRAAVQSGALPRDKAVEILKSNFGLQ